MTLPPDLDIHMHAHVIRYALLLLPVLFPVVHDANRG